jgi:hypothetical protein
VKIRSSLVCAFAIAGVLGLGALAPPAGAQSLSRAPYLQNATPTSVVVRWRTTTSSTTRVKWALSAAEITTPCNLPTCNQVDVAGTRTEHVVPLPGLPTETKVFYSVGTTTATLAGGDANHFINVPPLAGERRPIRIWVTSSARAAWASSISPSARTSRRAPR